MSRRKLVAGNWKMNGLGASLAEFERIRQAAAAVTGADALICPPATLIAAFAGKGLAVGGQDCHAKAAGAHTGDLSAEMLRDAGASAAILGHSERRADHGETDSQVRAKAEAARRAGLLAIICVGETLAQREAGEAVAVVEGQLAGSLPEGATAEGVVVAYEPVWAIGTGRAATPADVREIHAVIRKALSARFGAEGDKIRILYGGSVKPENAAEIFAVPDVDGALVGGASLTAAQFLPILQAAA